MNPNTNMPTHIMLIINTKYHMQANSILKTITRIKITPKINILLTYHYLQIHNPIHSNYNYLINQVDNQTIDTKINSIIKIISKRMDKDIWI
jgi:hypothetical protein